MRRWAERLRLIAAVLLIASLSLPVSKCTYYADADGKWVSGEIAQQNPAAVHVVTEYQYALERSKPASDRWLTLACFVLPLAMVLALQFVHHRAALLMLRYLEPLALAYSALGLIDLTLFGVASGGYLAAASLTIYLIAMLAIDAILVRTWWRERRRTEPIQSSRS